MFSRKANKKMPCYLYFLVGFISAVLSLGVLALMSFAPSYLFVFCLNNDLAFLESWLIMVMFVLAISLEVLVLFGPAIHYSVKSKCALCGIKMVLITLVFEILLVLGCVGGCWLLVVGY